MTISTTTTRTTYNGNGVTTVFTIPFRFLVNGDIVVVSVSAAGVETTKTLTTDYTLTGAGDDAGGTVTMLVAPANGTRLIIYRDTDIVQETDYISGDPFPAEAHERALDRLTMIAQEISPNIDRAIRVPVGDSSSLNTTLPAAVDRLDKFIVFDATTGATELSTVTQTQVASAVAAAYSAGSTADAVTFLPEGTGAVSRSVQSRLRDVVNVKDFGAVGDGVTDDTAAIQAAINHVASIRGSLYFPPEIAGQYYKVSATLNIPGPMVIFGDSPHSVILMGVGLAAGQYILSINLSAGSNYFFGIKGLTLRSLDGVPHGLYVKNASYLSVDDVQIYNVKKGVVLTGTNTFSSDFRKLVTYQIGEQGVRYPAFNGGGHHTFTNCTFNGNTGLLVDTDSTLDGLSLHSNNYEACVTNSLYVGGNVFGLSISGGRTEACAGDDFQINPALGKFVGGLSISGVNFTAASAASIPITLGGAGGQVRGFNISGNRVDVGALTEFVRLNGDGESGVISGNYFAEAGASPSLNQRQGVLVFANENSSGKCPEYWGNANWRVDQSTFSFTDGSGAGLSITSNGHYTIIGRQCFWQAYVLYPTTANTAAAKLTGLPASVLAGTSQQGRAGGRVDASNVGVSVGVLQGLGGVTSLSFVNPTAAATSILNSALSGKEMYLSGSFAI